MNKKEKSIVITSALRTAIGTFNGSLKSMQAHDLGSIVIKENIKKSNLKSNEIDEVIMGQVLTSATGQNPARQATIKAGIPIEKTAYIINQVCGSGLRAIAAGYQSILSNDSNIVIAGGQESMTNTPHAIHFRNNKKLEETNLIVLGLMVMIIVSDNSELFRAVKSSMLYPAFLLSMGIIGIKATIRVNR